MTETQGGVEHERRFLVADRSILEGTSFHRIDQGYLWARGGWAIRIRIVDSLDPESQEENDWGVMAVKGPRQNARRFEAEMRIPRDEAVALLDLSNFRVTKNRHGLIFQQDVWVVDDFLGENEGLLIAELEGSEQAVAAIKKPTWASREVTDDRRYDNESLAKTPVSQWETPPV